jgi:hypothetical protein
MSCAPIATDRHRTNALGGLRSDDIHSIEFWDAIECWEAADAGYACRDREVHQPSRYRRNFFSRQSKRRNRATGSDLWVQQGVAEMNTILGMTLAVMLMASGVWANISDVGTLAHARGAWVSRWKFNARNRFDQAAHSPGMMRPRSLG